MFSLSNKNNMINNLPLYLRKSEYVETVLGMSNKFFLLERERVSDLMDQFFIDTATWSLHIYEKELGIVTDETKSIETRRSEIKSKWNGNTQSGATLLKNIVNAWSQGDCDISFKNGKIIIEIVGYGNVFENIDEIDKNIKLVIPAHLGVEYSLISKIAGKIKSFALCISSEEITIYPRR